MRRLDAADALTLWELACAGPDALPLLARACPELPEGALAQLPLGRRDRALIDLRERCFGPRLPARADCPACREGMELDLSLPDLRVDAPAGPSACLVERDGFRVRLRPPSAADLAAVAGRGDPDDARLALLARCALELSRGGTPCPIEHVPRDLLDEAAAAVAALDPQADVELDLACPACGHRFSAALDILALLRAELRAHAVRLARDVHALASAYGWREADILALSPARRQLYLDLAGA